LIGLFSEQEGSNMEIQPLLEEAGKMKDQVIEWRRHFHRHPELSFQEVETARFVTGQLESFGNLQISHPTPTSVMARLIGDRPGKVLAIRADMDALPIQEENTFEFASGVPGVMHACGHDSHTAVLLAVAKILSARREQIRGEIRFLFQHAEEQAPGGAQEMVDAGVMEGVDWVIGAHLLSWIEYGKFGVAYGPMMASSDNFSITVKGVAGHAAYPHQSVDAVAVSAQIITNLQHIVARYTDPLDRLVVSVTQIHGGTTTNILPAEVKLGGTARCFNPELRTAVKEQMERIIKGITEAHGAEYEFVFEYGYRPVINDHAVTKIVEDAIADLYGAESIQILKPFMGSEDFSAFQQKAPGTFFMVGAGNPAKGIVHPHHHPLFTVDEDAMDKGVKVLLRAAAAFMEQSA
jgi:amidohydrolase